LIRFHVHTGPRRVSGVYRDVWCCCRWLRCKLCEEDRRELQKELEEVQGAHVFTPSAKVSRLKGLEERISKTQFWYRAYDPRVMKIFAERVSFVTARPAFIVANCHAALTIELA